MWRSYWRLCFSTVFLFRWFRRACPHISIFFRKPAQRVVYPTIVAALVTSQLSKDLSGKYQGQKADFAWHLGCLMPSEDGFAQVSKTVLSCCCQVSYIQDARCSDQEITGVVRHTHGVLAGSQAALWQVTP